MFVCPPAVVVIMAKEPSGSRTSGSQSSPTWPVVTLTAEGLLAGLAGPEGAVDLDEGVAFDDGAVAQALQVVGGLGVSGGLAGGPNERDG